MRCPWPLNGTLFAIGGVFVACSLSDPSASHSNGDGGNRDGGGAAATGGRGAGGAPVTGGKASRSGGGAGTGGSRTVDDASVDGAFEPDAAIEAGIPDASVTRPDCTACTPKPVATGVRIGSFAVSAPVLYYYELTADSGSGPVQRVSTSGGVPQSIALGSPAHLLNIVADASYVYATDLTTDSGGNILVSRCSVLSGTQFTGLEDGSMITVGGYMRQNTANVFLMSSLSQQYVTRFPKAGGKSATPVTSAKVELQGYDVDEDSVFVFSGDALTRVPVLGGDAMILWAPAGGEKIVDLALSKDVVVIATSTRVATVPKSGGDATTLSAGAAYGVRADAEGAYFFRSNAGSDASCSKGSEAYGIPLSGGSPQHLATAAAPGCVTHVTQDTASLYWLTGDEKSVVKAPKH